MVTLLVERRSEEERERGKQKGSAVCTVRWNMLLSSFIMV